MGVIEQFAYPIHRYCGSFRTADRHNAKKLVYETRVGARRVCLTLSESTIVNKIPVEMFFI
jgi:hypothetical protein